MCVCDYKMEISLIDYGNYLGVKGQEFVIYENKEPVKTIPFHKVKRAIISSGNNVSTSALYWLATYGVETLITSKTNEVVSVLTLYLHDCRVNTRIKQY